MKALIINQDIQTQRMSFQKEQLTSLNIDFQRIPACSIQCSNDNIFQKHFNTWQRPLSLSEISCFFSHKNAWEKVLNSGQVMLILEDDAWLDESIPDVLKQLADLEQVDYITLEVSRANRKKLVSKNPKVIISGKKLLRLFQGRSGAAGYILWPSGAKKLLDHCADGNIGIVDKFMNSCYSMNSFQLEPCLVIQLDQCSFHGITPPLEVKSTISSNSLEKPAIIQQVRYKFRRLAGELKVGLNLLLHSYNTEHRNIVLSDNFKKRV